MRRQRAQLRRARGAFVERHRQRVVERARALLDVVRVHRERRRLQLVVRAGLGREAQHAVAAVDDRPFLGDEVESVAQRVDEQHVVALHARDGTGEVVAVVEQDRHPVARRPAVVDARHGLLDLVLVREVLGEALARRVHHRDEHDPAPQARARFEQPVVGEEAADDVLRRFDAVGARDHEPVADRVGQRGSRRRAPRPTPATSSSAATSGPRLATNGARNRGAAGRARRAPTAGTPRPSAWCGTRPGPTRARAQSSAPMSVGSSEKSSGPANGVWVKCTTRRSGRSARSCPGTSASW